MMDWIDDSQTFWRSGAYEPAETLVSFTSPRPRGFSTKRLSPP